MGESSSQHLLLRITSYLVLSLSSSSNYELTTHSKKERKKVNIHTTLCTLCSLSLPSSPPSHHNISYIFVPWYGVFSAPWDIFSTNKREREREAVMAMSLWHCAKGTYKWGKGNKGGNEGGNEPITNLGKLKGRREDTKKGKWRIVL